jgi:hypothetical protein
MPRLVVVARRVELPDVVVMTVSSSDVTRDSMDVSVYLVEEEEEDGLLVEADGADVRGIEETTSAVDDEACGDCRAKDEAGDGENRAEEMGVLDRLEAGLGDGDRVDVCRTDDDGGVSWEDGGVQVDEGGSVVDGTTWVSSELEVDSTKDSSVLDSEFGSDHHMIEDEDGSGVHQTVLDCCVPSVSQLDMLCGRTMRFSRGKEGTSAWLRKRSKRRRPADSRATLREGGQT